VSLIFVGFLVLSALAIFCGLMTVLSKNPIHSVLYIVACFFAIAGHYFLLNAAFLGMVQIIVYAGAIMVLFLSTLMLMNLNEETEKHKPAIVRMGAVVAGGLLLLVLVAALHKAAALPGAAPEDVNVSSIANLGKVLLDEYLFPFEFASVLFLSAMIGAVLLTKKDKVQSV
jgi:NADH-quinone oxidoreductase subunit J